MSEEKKSTPVPFAYPVTAWAQKRAHPTFIDSKDNFLKNKFTLLLHHAYLSAQSSNVRFVQSRNVWL